MSQLTFQFDATPNYSGENFLIGDNNCAAFNVVHAWPNWPAPTVILTGPVGVGKTHLLNLWCAHAKALPCPAGNLQGDFNPTRYVERPIAIDDADQVSAQVGRERALLHLYNLALQNKQTLLMTAERHPQHWGLLLPDLASRLRAAVVVEVREPDEHLMRQLYQKLFADRQLNVPEQVIDWLLLRLDRSAVTAQNTVLALDHAALEHQKPITIWLARKVLGYGDDEDESNEKEV